jgi:hypothetical protein
MDCFFASLGVASMHILSKKKQFEVDWTYVLKSIKLNGELKIRITNWLDITKNWLIDTENQ